VTIQITTIAERVDAALDLLVDGRSASSAAAAAHLPPAEHSLLEVGYRLRAALAVPAVAPRFEARLGARLASVAIGTHPIAWARRHPGRLLVTGAVGSAVGVGVTAYAVWRSARRAPRASHRLLHR
jgi:hypothetical protein